MHECTSRFQYLMHKHAHTDTRSVECRTNVCIARASPDAPVTGGYCMGTPSRLYTRTTTATNTTTKTPMCLVPGERHARPPTGTKRHDSTTKHRNTYGCTHLFPPCKSAKPAVHARGSRLAGRFMGRFVQLESKASCCPPRLSSVSITPAASPTPAPSSPLVRPDGA